MSLYTALRHFADSYALVVICALYLTLCLWHFRPAARARINEAKLSIFKDDDDGQR